MNTTVKLTPQLKSTILAALRGGAFLHDAFRLAAVPDHIWRRWLTSTHTRGRLYAFQCEIKQAQAQARFLAAQAVKAESPDKWLANGPGRDIPGEPGWAAMTQPNIPALSGEIDPTTIPAFAKFVHNVRLVFACFPAAAAMFEQLQHVQQPLQISDNSP